MGVFVGGLGNDSLTGSSENDLLQGQAGRDSLSGGAGQDTLEGADDGDLLDGGEGADELFGGQSADRLLGGGGSDTLFGEAGGDVLHGGAGDDLINGGADAGPGSALWGPFWGLTYQDPFTGTDAVTYETAAAGVVVSLASQGPQNTGEGVDTLIDIEQLWGSPFNDSLAGDERRNKLYGYSGNDTLAGAGGDDVLAAQGGNDSLAGGDGHDVLLGGYVSEEGRELAWGDDTMRGGAGNDTLVGGGDGQDVLDGGDGDDELWNIWPLADDEGRNTAGGAARYFGGAGNDNIGATLFDAEVDGGDGNDLIRIARTAEAGLAPQVLTSISAGAGDDTIWLGHVAATDVLRIDGGSGANTLVLRDWRIAEIYLNQEHSGPGVTAIGFQTVEYDNTSTRLHGGDVAETYLGNDWGDWISAGGGSDYIRGDRDVTVGGWTLGGRETVYGGAGDDTILGMVDQDFLRGDEGNDSLSGGAAWDDLHGNMGDDTVAGGDGDDWVVGGKDQDLLSGDAGLDIVLGNLGADTLDGGADRDVVRGGQANDLVSGGGGDDFVSGDRGDDTVTGGSGGDTFHSFGDAGIDLVTDFNAAEGDRVNLLAGSTYTLAQAAGDTIITIDGSAKVVLAGVTLAALPDGWLYLG